MSKKRLVTGKMILEASKSGRDFEVLPGDLITALARDLAKEKQVRLVQGSGQTPLAEKKSSSLPKIVIASDHGGYELKKDLIPFLTSLGYPVSDEGPFSADAVDYPDFAYAVGRRIQDRSADIGIMIDGAGLGSAMALNKMKGILAAPCHNEFTARNARQHNHANVLTLGSRDIGLETAKSVVKAFLTAIPEPGRHEARVAKIREIEERFFR